MGGHEESSAGTSFKETELRLSRLKQVVVPEPFGPEEWVRWGRARAPGLWAVYVGIAGAWLSPVIALFVGEASDRGWVHAPAMMLAVPSLLIYLVSLFFVFTWWPVSMTPGRLAELAVTPASPWSYVRSCLRPLQVLLALGCVPVLLLKPGCDLIAVASGKSYLAGEWVVLAGALNLVLCAVFDAFVLICLLAWQRKPARALALAPVLLLLHAPVVGYPALIPEPRAVSETVGALIFVLSCGLQAAIAVILVSLAPRVVNGWASTAMGKGT